MPTARIVEDDAECPDCGHIFCHENDAYEWDYDGPHFSDTFESTDTACCPKCQAEFEISCEVYIGVD